MANTEMRRVECTETDLILFRGSQTRCLLQNPTDSRLSVHFLLTSFLLNGEDLHIFCVPEDIATVADVVKQMGGDHSIATRVTKWN